MKYARRGGWAAHQIIEAVPHDRWVSARQIDQEMGGRYGSARIAQILLWDATWAVERRRVETKNKDYRMQYKKKSDDQLGKEHRRKPKDRMGKHEQ